MSPVRRGGIALVALLAVLVVLVVLPRTRKAATNGAPDSSRVDGIALAEIHPGHGLKPYREALDRIRDLGAGWVLLPVYGWVDSAAAAVVDTSWLPPVTLATYCLFTRDIVREAHRRGLRVLLIPYLNLRTGDPKEWRGTLRPEDWDRWFDSYQRFLDPWVDLAREERVERLGIGAELVSAESQADSWRRLVARVRSQYHGIILYSCNWDHYRGIPWLDTLDEVGISAYFSLAWNQPLTDGAIDSLWHAVALDLDDYQRTVGRPLLLTEVGLPSIRGAAHDPWNYLAEGPADAAGQARALAAFSRVFADRSVPAGVLFWEWSPFRGGAGDRSYSIRGKPAERVVRDWLRRAR